MIKNEPWQWVSICIFVIIAQNIILHALITLRIFMLMITEVTVPDSVNYLFS